MGAFTLSNIIINTECKLAKYKFILEQFPDAKIFRKGVFTSKIVNNNYTHLTFETRYRSLYVRPYCIVKFDYLNQSDNIKVHSSPMYNRLAYIKYCTKDHKSYITFSKAIINFKRNNFKSDLANQCCIAIVNFIKNNSRFNINYNNLDPKIKTLLLLS
jgi:hypothetical protein